MVFNPQFWTTLVGSFPHMDAAPLCQRILSSVDIPAWPQLPRRTFRENMCAQFSTYLPGIKIDEATGQITFNITSDMSRVVDKFYSRCQSYDVDSFAIVPDHAAGFYAMIDILRSAPGEWVKGHVTGPITLGLQILDAHSRPSLYDKKLSDMIVKGVAMAARWQIRQLRTVRPHVIVFVDEPHMASFGSAFFRLSRDRVVAILNEVFTAIHQEGALAGVHCCGNTDWSVLLTTSADILNLDTYGYLDKLVLYPAELRAFLDRGGVMAWGVVPNTEEVFQVTPKQLADRLFAELALISGKARVRGITIPVEDFASRSLITPACGLGTATVEVAEQTMEMLAQTARLLQQG